MAGPERVPRSDHLFLVATSTELDAMKHVATEMGFEWTGRTDPDLGRHYRMDAGGGTAAVVVRTEMGAIGLEGSAVAAWRFQAATQAATLVQVGTAFGISPGDQSIGDVLVATSLLPYDNRNVGTEAGIERITYSRVAPVIASRDIVRRCEIHKTIWDAGTSVRLGALLSGGAAISRADFRKQLWSDLLPRTNEPIVGGEMEAIGLVGVGGGSDPRWGVIKGISDFADEHRASHIAESRVVAANNAARFALGALLGKR